MKVSDEISPAIASISSEESVRARRDDSVAERELGFISVIISFVQPALTNE